MTRRRSSSISTVLEKRYCGEKRSTICIIWSLWFSFTCFFPLLMTLVHKFRSFRVLLPVAGVAIQLAVYVYRYRLEKPLEHAYLYCATYFGYFAVGSFIGLHYRAIHEWLGKHKTAVYSLFAAAGIVYSGMFLLNRFEFFFPGYWYDLVYFMYCCAALLCFILAGSRLPGRMPGVYRVLNALAGVSFGIYLIHPMVLTAWNLKFTDHAAQHTFFADVLARVCCDPCRSLARDDCVQNRPKAV